jgi:hypothetical protein
VLRGLLCAAFGEGLQAGVCAVTVAAIGGSKACRCAVCAACKGVLGEGGGGGGARTVSTHKRVSRHEATKRNLSQPALPRGLLLVFDQLLHDCRTG